MFQHFQIEQLESQGLLWAALTPELFPTSPSQGLLTLTQMTSPNSMLRLEAARLSGTLPHLALPQMTDHDLSSHKKLACQIPPATLSLVELATKPPALQACSVQHL